MKKNKLSHWSALSSASAVPSLRAAIVAKNKGLEEAEDSWPTRGGLIANRRLTEVLKMTSLGFIFRPDNSLGSLQVKPGSVEFVEIY